MRCSDVSVVDNSSSTSSDRFNISNSCALFDFAVYTVGVGSMVILGVAGNALSFGNGTYPLETFSPGLYRP